MKKVSNLLQNARNTEVASVSGKVMAEYKKGNWESDLYLKGIFTKLEPATENLTGAINRIKTESDLDEKDEIRDIHVKAINGIVTGFIQHPNTVIKAAAQKVDAIFEHYGVQITNESYATESSLINSLLQDFADVEIQSAIAALPGLSPIIDNLKTSQAAFEEAELKFKEEKAKEGKEVNATAIRKEVVTIINDILVVHLNAMVQIDEAKYGTLAGTVAQIIDDMNVTVKKRRKTVEPVNTTTATPA